MQVTVAVLTYRRNAELAALLPLLRAQAAELSRGGPSTEVLVVDNDPDGGARPVVAEHPEVRYVVEPSPGIAAARNRALDESAGSATLVFIDDDERPEPGWLAALVEAQGRYGAAAVAGPVESVFDGELDPWITAGAFFRRVHTQAWRTGDELGTAATNNLLVDLRVVRRHGLRFDPALGLSGGEDSLFTGALVAAGERLVWCREARVLDRVPAARMTREFVLRRVFAQSNASARVRLRLATGPAGRLAARGRYAAAGSVRCVLGGAKALVGTVSGVQRWQAGGLNLVARGAGNLSGAVGVGYQQYRRERAVGRR